MIVANEDLSRTLYPYQRAGVRRLVHTTGTLLGDEMGLGKTVQAILAMESLFRDGAISRALIVCPASLLVNWRAEIRRWAPGRGVLIYRGQSRFGLLGSHIPILVTSFETIVADWKVASAAGEQFFSTEFDLIIVDEAQRLKNPHSLRATVLSKAIIARRWAMTGTPLENRPEELASILRFLDPNEFQELDQLKDYAHVLKQRDRFLLRRKKSEVLEELPAKRVVTVPVEMHPVQRAEYDDCLADLREQLAAKQEQGGGTLLAGITKLRRLCISSSDNEYSGKFDLLEEELEELCASGEKVIVFSSFPHEVLPTLSDRLQRFGVVTYTGRMSLDDREVSSIAFREEARTHVMLASLGAAGVGITWTEARYVYHLDLWWNPQVLHQAEDRVHRIGQTRGVLVKRLVAAASIEEGIERMLEKKEQLFGAVLEEEDEQTEPNITAANLGKLLEA